ncbi:proline-rich transmembrane protein 4-like [Lampetra planeri]
MHQPTNCPFDKEEDWGRAVGAGIGASLCFLGCGGLQLYSILHALGLGGVDGYGFMPWPWWIYQTGCRLCETGVCLGLSLIGAHPLFCRNKSIKTISRPGPARWSRLSCGSPSRGLIPAPQGDQEHSSWPQAKQEKVVVCEVLTKTPERQSEAFPLCSVVDRHGNGRGPKVGQTKIAAPHPPTPPSPPHDPKDASQGCRLSSLISLSLAADSTVDLRPPSPIDLSRSIDQALFSESVFSHSIFGPQRLFNASSSLSLSSPSQGTSNQGPSSLEDALYRTSSCGDLDKENTLSSTRPPRLHDPPHDKPEQQLDWKGSVSGSTLGLCSKIKEKGNIRSHSWANRGQHFPQGSLPRAIPHLSYHRRYRTLSVASHDSQGPGRLSGD